MRPGCWAPELGLGESWAFSEKCDLQNKIQTNQSMFYHLSVCSAGSHLASRFGTSLLVRPWDQLSVTRDRTVRCRCLRHSFEQGDGLALGPPPSHSFSDWQRGQRIGESIGRLHGTPVGLGGRHWENLQVLREGNCRGKQHGAQM